MVSGGWPACAGAGQSRAHLHPRSRLRLTGVQVLANLPVSPPPLPNIPTLRSSVVTEPPRSSSDCSSSIETIETTCCTTRRACVDLFLSSVWRATLR
ncbi:hypothetical protein J6590_006670 [Homalodisca vitripennis]|nr:hypothetical protein J6590_006670 [Homalodisca vitripennis]